jgi:hypothetical protein
MRGIARAATSPGRIYLTGGASSLLLDIRKQTADIDIKLSPEPGAAFEAIARLKDSLDINIELASPDHFIPPLPRWEQRSQFIVVHGAVEFYHYDFYSQALSKILRGHPKDLDDVRAYARLRKIQLPKLKELFHSVEAAMIRYPAIRPDVFEAKLNSFIQELS